MKLDRIPEFDGLRGLLAWWVVVGHIAYNFSDRLGAMIHNSEAVYAFMVLSGFVISYLLTERQEGYCTFIVRRWFRLFPVFFVILCLSALTIGLQIEALVGLPFREGSSYQASQLEAFALSKAYLQEHFLSHLTMLHGAMPAWVLVQADSTLIPPAWSLSVEWQFYLLAPFLIMPFVKERSWAWTYAGLMLAVLLYGQTIPGYKEISGFLPGSIFYFTLGIVCFYLWREREQAWLKKPLPWVCLVFMIDQAIRAHIGVVVWMFVFMAIMNIGPAVLKENLRKFLNCSIMQKLGAQSYPLYLGHFFVLVMVFYALRPLQSELWLWGILVWVLTLAGSWGFAALLHRYVEAPGIRLGCKVSRKLSR